MFDVTLKKKNYYALFPSWLTLQKIQLDSEYSHIYYSHIYFKKTSHKASLHA